MTEVLINIKLNGVAVKATFDTDSSATVVKESLWKRNNTHNVSLIDSSRAHRTPSSTFEAMPCASSSATSSAL